VSADDSGCAVCLAAAGAGAGGSASGTDARPEMESDIRVLPSFDISANISDSLANICSNQICWEGFAWHGIILLVEPRLKLDESRYLFPAIHRLRKASLPESPAPHTEAVIAALC
jgi:hypothetical protein